MPTITPGVASPAENPAAEGGCAFPIDALGAGRHRGRSCGAPPRPGSPYCAEHHALCYVPPESLAERRRLLEIEALAEAVGGKTGRIARRPPVRLLRRLDRVSRSFSTQNRSRIVPKGGEDRDAENARTR